MQCKGCGYPHSEVVYTRSTEDKSEINRRRACLRCGLRFTTTENAKQFKDHRFKDRERLQAK